MKPFVSSQISKNALLISVFTTNLIGLTMLNSPEAVANQNICIKKLFGLCVQYASKPTLAKNQTDNDSTEQVDEQEQATWKIKQPCERKGNLVRCSLSLMGKVDLGRQGIQFSSTKAVDSTGNEYLTNLIKFGSKQISKGDVVVDNVVKGANYSVVVSFSGVPSSASKFVSLQIGGALSYMNRPLVTFRDIPIQ